MEAWLLDWLSLLLRWAHFITGIAWIGASFYFNWLENQLERRAADDPIAGELWAVHGGGFYYLQKYRLAPGSLPPRLHWFKYEAYFTWLTGFALLVVVYYLNPALYLVHSAQPWLTPGLAVGASVLSLAAAWVVYDGLCRSPLRHHPLWLALALLAGFGLLAWALGEVFSGRAAYLHAGAAIGTVMVANVFFVIIPAQKELTAAVAEGRDPDGSKGENALLRSRHNNYLTLPVLFLMVSNHYPATYGQPRAWLVLLVFSIAAIGIRHWFNIRHRPEHNRLVLPASLLLMAGLIAATLPRPHASIEAVSRAPVTADIMPVIAAHCSVCHAERPRFAGIPAPPLGVVLETLQQVEALADRIHQTSVATTIMPLANTTGMSDGERALLGRWYAGLRRAEGGEGRGGTTAAPERGDP